MGSEMCIRDRSKSPRGARFIAPDAEETKRILAKHNLLKPMTVPAGTFKALKISAIGTYDNEYTCVGDYWVAPGVGIVSTMPTYEVYLTSPELPRDERFRENYDAMSGTSQAAPFVSALAALLFSVHPDWDAPQVARHIRETAADIAALNPGVELGGRMDACVVRAYQPVQARGYCAARASPAARRAWRRALHPGR